VLSEQNNHTFIITFGFPERTSMSESAFFVVYEHYA
jgi:hypothetical protein